MKRLLAGAMLAVLCGMPVVSRAETPRDTKRADAPAAPYYLARPAVATGDEASEYAQREQAAPQLADFAGGADGVYITSGAIAVALIVVLILVLL